MVDDRCLSKDAANIANYYLITAYLASFYLNVNTFVRALFAHPIPLFAVGVQWFCNIFGYILLTFVSVVLL